MGVSVGQANVSEPVEWPLPPTAVSGTPHIMKALIKEWTVHLSTTHERSPPQPLSPQPGSSGMIVTAQPVNPPRISTCCCRRLPSDDGVLMECLARLTCALNERRMTAELRGQLWVIGVTMGTKLKGRYASEKAPFPARSTAPTQCALHRRLARGAVPQSSCSAATPPEIGPATEQYPTSNGWHTCSLHGRRSLLK